MDTSIGCCFEFVSITLTVIATFYVRRKIVIRFVLVSSQSRVVNICAYKLYIVRIYYISFVKLVIRYVDD